MTIMAVSTRGRLRAATAEIHTALHNAPAFAAIAAGTITLARYGETLALLHRYHASLAPPCLAGAVALDAADLGRVHAARIALLEEDLAAMGLEAPQPLPCETSDPGFCAGILYTVQGSTLGGKVIHRQLDALLPGAAGRLFFKGGADDSRDWQMLCARLEETDLPLERLIAGAMHGFGLFRDLVTPEP